MDAAKRKELFRAKLNAQKKEKRIDSPLVRYNEADQPVCRVCNVVVKSESLWDAHQVSRKHQEAINTLKANAARQAQVRPESRKESTGPKHASNASELNDSNGPITKPTTSSGLPADFFDNNKTKSTSSKYAQNSELGDKKLEPSEKLSKRQSSSVLPPNFFDDSEAKRQKTDTEKPVNLNSQQKLGGSVQKVKALTELDREFTRAADISGSSTDMKQAKGALPEGFFDNKEADLRARGVKLVKPNVQDEYKEFEKLIQVDLREVDDRLEEEEIDAAETIEEAETVEQKTYRERVEFLRKKKMELTVARSAKRSEKSEDAKKPSSDDESSSDDDDENVNFAVDWRAQHL